MGTWGVGLYQNDTACDVRDTWVEKLRQGAPAEAATAELLQEWGAPDDDPLFWLGLADTQWTWGRPDPLVRDRARVVLVDPQPGPETFLILLDANVLVALADEHDAHHARAARDPKRLRKGPFGSTVPVLSETCHILSSAYLRSRLRALLRLLDVAIVDVPARIWDEIFDWMEHDEEHGPDLADAQLVILSAINASFRIWSYDKEFAAV